MNEQRPNEKATHSDRHNTVHNSPPTPAAETRAMLIRRGLALSILTVCWDLIEGVVALVAGLFSGSVALIGFGVDSFIETASAFIVGWRFAYEMRGRSNEQVERAERIASVTAGVLLLLLAVYLLADSLLRLFGHGREPGTSLAGIVITGASFLVMPVLGWVKLRTASASRSSALRADAYETITCAWLSLTTLAGLGLNALFGWWWADPLAALVLVPLIIREGLEGVRGEEGEDDGDDEIEGDSYA